MHRRERRRQRDGVERRQRDREGDGDGELRVEPSRRAGEEGDRDEHRDQNERGCDDRAENLAHGVRRRFSR